MSLVYLDAASISSVGPRITRDGTVIGVQLEMNTRQCKALVIELLGRHMGEQERREFLRSEFSDDLPEEASK